MQIELQETLEQSLKNGVNLFVGAGFSTFSKDQDGRTLPTGAQLAEELISKFNCPKINDLSKICTIVDSYDSDGLKKFLTHRFNVSEYEPFYTNLININAKRVFTTNIDNLISKIFATSSSKFINNVFTNGSCFNDSKCIDYIPIHGSIEIPESKFLFNKQEISGSFRTEISAWINLNNSAGQLPSVFLGYSLDDVGAIEALFNSKKGEETQKTKWILLREADPGQEAYFRALGFKILIGDIREFFEFISQLDFVKQNSIAKKDNIDQIFPEACIPKNHSAQGRIRQIDEFFLGSAPIWSDILSNRVYPTSHLDEIANLVEKPKNIIVTGIPASGKSTLLLQLAKKLSHNKRILYFNDLSFNKSNIIKNEINSPTLILVDNFTSDIESFLNLTNNKNIKVIGFDRYYNIDISSHKLPGLFFEFYDVTDITPQDIQGIYNTIPLTIRKTPMTSRKEANETPSVFEVVNYNINKPDLNDRYRDILIELNTSNPILLDLLIMSAYVHSCMVPVSFEVANAFLYEDTGGYQDVLDLMESLRGMVHEAIGSLVDNLEADQDYYQPRSQILAETIIAQTKHEHFRRVFEKFHEAVPKYLIPNFHVFKRFGYDAFYVTKAFSNWEEGLEFYERSYQTEKNPFLLQQCALFLLKKKRFVEAALKIDKALQISHKRFYSIENTHAIILFKANISVNSNDPNIRTTLDKSMDILIDCYAGDQRKTYHAVTFADQALEYFTKYPDGRAKEYLIVAKEWLKDTQGERKYYGRLKAIRDEINKLV